MNKLISFMCILLAPVLAAADDEDCRYSAERAAQASTDGIKQIVVRAGAGNLKIVGQPGGRELNAVGLACASRENQLEELQLRLERQGDRLTLTTEIPDSAFRVSNWFGSGIQRIDLSVKLPLGIALEVEEGSGEAEISNVGALIVSDGSGELRITDIHGGLEVTDGSGEIEIREVDGSVRLSDGSGAVSIAHVRGDAVITLDGSGAIEIEDVQGNVTIGKDGSGEINIARVSGSVRIEEDGSGGIVVSNVKHDVFIDEDGSGEIDVEDIEGDLRVGKDGSGGIHHRRIGGSVQLEGDANNEAKEDGNADSELDVERE